MEDNEPISVEEEGARIRSPTIRLVIFLSLMGSLIATAVSYLHVVAGVQANSLTDNGHSYSHGYPLHYVTTYTYGPNSVMPVNMLIDVIIWFAIIFAVLFIARTIKLRAFSGTDSP